MNRWAGENLIPVHRRDWGLCGPRPNPACSQPRAPRSFLAPSYYLADYVASFAPFFFFLFFFFSFFFSLVALTHGRTHTRAPRTTRTTRRSPGYASRPFVTVFSFVVCWRAIPSTTITSPTPSALITAKRRITSFAVVEQQRSLESARLVGPASGSSSSIITQYTTGHFPPSLRELRHFRQLSSSSSSSFSSSSSSSSSSPSSPPSRCSRSTGSPATRSPAATHVQRQPTRTERHRRRHHDDDDDDDDDTQPHPASGAAPATGEQPPRWCRARRSAHDDARREGGCATVDHTPRER